MGRISITVLLLGCLATTVLGAVIGIDFGSEYIKVASVRPGAPFHIVIDESSKRLIPSIVGFDAKERVFGNGAVSLSVSKSDRAYMYVHRLLGKKLDSPEVQQLKDMGFQYEFVDIDGRNSVGIKHHDGSVFSPEELIAMSFEHIRELVLADAEGQQAKDVVLTVPSYWTQNQRMALVNAAEMAGFSVLSLINTNTAAAVQYGIDLDYNKFNDTTKHVLFYNMGAMSTEVSLVSFNSYTVKQSRKVNKTIGQLEVRSVASDPYLGGNMFDKKLVDKMAEEFNKILHKKYPDDDVRKHLRPMAKLRSAASKAKKVLSANKDTPVFVVSLYKDIDFVTKFTREDFIEMNKDLIDRVVVPLQSVLEERGLKPEDIDNIIILGGCTRIPVVQAKIKEFMGRKDLGQNINGDEAMALGAVFRAANLSTAFQVRKLGLVEVTNYPAGVRLGDLNAPAEDEKPFSKRAQLFKRYNRVAKRKTVGFSHTNDFFCTMHYDSPKLLPSGESPDVAYWNITGLGEACKDPKNAELLKTQKPRVAVSFTLTSSGTVALAKVEATLEEMVKVPKKKEKKAKTEEKKDEKESSGEDAKKEEEKKEEKKEASGEAEEEKEVEYVDKKITHKIELKASMGYPIGSVHPMTAEELTASKTTLAKLSAADQLMKKIALTKNKLESYIYAVRSEGYEENFEEVTTEEQRENITASLRAAEDWLFDQEDDGYEKFNTKFKLVKSIAEPVYTRIKEAVDRPAAINQTHTLLNYTKTMVADFDTERPWIPQEDKDKVAAMTAKVEEWLKTKSAEQDKLQAHEMPAFYSHQLISKLKPIAKFSAELLRRPKPKPKRRKARKGKNATDTSTGTSSGESSAEGDVGEEKKDESKEEKKEEEKKEEETKDEKKEL